ncbi:hypothetical protein F4679DRAFT_553113 [Xylaria curta]|nr:hypothetical protein F4679DRAFT_553113 [Xylaria curta]
MSHLRPLLPSSNISEPPPKKRDVVSQACHACRKLKAKCTGGRPSCRTCMSRKRQCVYDREKRSSVAALRSQIKILEQQVGQSQHASEASASETQHQLRSRSASVPQATSPDQSPSIIPQRFLPSISVTQQAVDGFFSSSGKLFHIFTRSQASDFMDSVWKAANIESQNWKANVCCLMAIAAVGTQYTESTGGTDASDTFYDISKVYLDSVLEMRPLDAVKIYSLLSMYNVTEKAVASLVYADTGLALCRRFGLYCQRCQLPSLTDAMWMDYRRAFRTLMFLSTWVSATLGYKSGNQYLFERVFPSDLNADDVSDISEAVRSEMVRIAALKVKILYLNTGHRDLDLAIAALARDLEEWYNNLPQAMRLQEISKQDLPPDTRRSIYLVHLTYLGTNMLLFRRMASLKVRSSKAHGAVPASARPSREQYLKQADEALLAASGSARIIKIMMDENCVPKRCSIVIFQSYTSCIILLHAVLGKIALNPQPFGCEEDFENIRSCLSTLSFCGSLDNVAARFHASLLSVYNLLMKAHAKKLETTHNYPDTGYRQPFTLKENAAVNTTIISGPQEILGSSSRRVDQSIEDLSTNLLSMLCRPFGDPINSKESEECLDEGYMAALGQKGHQCLMEKLDWDFDNTEPFPR